MLPALRCPHCGGDRVHRSRYRGLEWLAIVLLVRPFRCHECSFRYWKPQWFFRIVERL
jgi:predicted Zn-ribbon and HTH transcriptional regulator